MTQARILSWVDFVGFLLHMKPQEFKDVGKQILARHIRRRQHIQLSLVIYMALCSPTAPRKTDNCGSLHELESPEVQNWVTLLTLSWLTLICLVTEGVLLNYKKFQTKTEMLEEWEIIASLRLDFCLLVVKIDI